MTTIQLCCKTLDARPLGNAMTTQGDCLFCEVTVTAERLAERRNPDGTVTVWYLCSRCAKITTITSMPLGMSPISPMYAP